MRREGEKGGERERRGGMRGGEGEWERKKDGGEGTHGEKGAIERARW